MHNSTIRQYCQSIIFNVCYYWVLQDLTNNFDLNFDLIVTGDAAWILLRSQMEDYMELLLQKHVL